MYNCFSFPSLQIARRFFLIGLGWKCVKILVPVAGLYLRRAATEVPVDVTLQAQNGVVLLYGLAMLVCVVKDRQRSLS